MAHSSRRPRQRWPDPSPTYSPLDPEKSEIRVLVVESGSPSDLVCCSLRVVSLDSDFRYETISYAWGDARKRDWIYLHGQYVDVPASSKAAIRRMRLRHERRILWIDAVCIDQKDPKERSQQVSMMGRIFRQGLRNLIFLSDRQDRGVSRAVAAFGRVVIAVRNALDELDEDEKLDFVQYNFAPDQWRTGNFLSPDDLTALQPIFESTWFTRIWIVQETVLSHDNVFFLGPAEFDVNDTLMTAALISDVGIVPYLEDLVGLGAYRGLHGGGRIADRYGSVRSDVYKTFGLARSSECSDTRDYVFATFHLVRQDDERPYDLLLPNYMKATTEVFRDATRFALQHELDWPLIYVNHRSEAEMLDDSKPSWTPYWGRPVNVRMDPAILPPLGAHAGKQREPKELSIVLATSEPNVLRARGFLLGACEVFCPPLLYENLVHVEVVKALLLRVMDACTRFPQAVSYLDTQIDPGIFAMELLTLNDYDWGTPSTFGSRVEKLEAFHEFIRGLQDTKPRLPASRDTASPSGKFYQHAKAMVHRRRIFTAGNKFIGFGPAIMQDGDVVAVLVNSHHPIILRQVENHYRLLGVAHIPMLADGRVFDLGIESEWIDIH